MRLNANLGAAIVSLLFLMSMVGMRAELEGEWLRDESRPRYVPVFAPPAIVPVFPGAVGDAAGGMDLCYDSLSALGGPYSPKVWRITSSDTTNGASLKVVIRDSLPAYPAAQLKVVEIILDTLHITHDAGNVVPISSNCVIIAGQTAQGGGLYTRNRALTVDDANRVLVQYATFQDGTMGLNADDGKYIYFDHITGRWNATGAGQMSIQVGGQGMDSSSRYVTVDNSLVYEPKNAHPTVISFSGGVRDDPLLAQATLTRSMIASSGYRNPLISADTITTTRTISYNWHVRGTEANHQAIGNFVGMFHHTGPATGSGTLDELPFTFTDECSAPLAGTDSICARQVYVAREWYLSEVGKADTLLPGDARDYWAGADSIISCRDETTTGYINSSGASQECSGGDGSVVPTGWKSSTFIAHESWDFPPDTTALDSTAVEAILATVGNSRKLDCNGDWANRRDGYDSARVAWFRNNWLDLGGEEGLNNAEAAAIDDDATTGGVYVPGNPTGLGGDTISIAEYSPATGGPCTDADGDGMFAAWESANGFSDSDASDAGNDPDGDGWINLLEFLFGSDPLIFTDTDGTESAPDPQNSTYATGRNVYLVPVNQDTVITRDTLGAVVDTFVARRPDSDSIDAGTPYRAIIVSDRDSALIVTCDTMTVPAAGVQDSAAVDSIVSAWGVNLGTTYPRSVTTPGC